MKGTVVVQAASAGSGGSGGSSDTGWARPTTAARSRAIGELRRHGSGLPSTGGETLSIALLGIATLGIGLLLRRRHESLSRRLATA